MEHPPSVVRIGAAEVVVGGLAGYIDAEGNEGDTKARKGLPQVVRQHRMLPPLVPPPEELPSRP